MLFFSVSKCGDITDRYGDYNGFDDTIYTEELIQTAVNAESGSRTFKKQKVYYCRQEAADGGYIVAIADMHIQEDIVKALAVRTIYACAAVEAILLILNIISIHIAIEPTRISWNMQREFTANSSHELKTPLTVIMTNAELLCSEGQSEENKTRFAENILSEAINMRELVENMLDLARADSDAIKVLFKKLDFTKLTEDTIMPFEPLFFESGRRLNSDIAGGIFVNGSGRDLSHAVSILLDNALKYSKPETQINVSLKSLGMFKCRLSVASCGESLSKKDCENIFERFYRTEKSQHVEHSYGLGLPIARLIVNKHRGNVWAESKDGINTFYIELPRKKKK